MESNLNSKILLITNLINNSKIGGRELFSLLILKVLRKIYKNNLLIIYLKRKKKINVKDRIFSFFGYIDGINKKSAYQILKCINKYKIKKVIINGSNLGKISLIIKKKFPFLKIITFFHNIESVFFLDLLRVKKNIKSLIIFVINYFAEKNSTKYSDIKICLTKKDAYDLNRIYGSKSNFVIPLAVNDKLKNLKIFKKVNNNNFILFVGGGFFGNLHGIEWFINKVLPKININLVVIGRELNSIKKKRIRNLKIMHNVKNLNSWYLNARFVISPIFYGSGMKSKIAEALMYGKKIVGTDKSFLGYDKSRNKFAIICKSENSFIKKINKLIKKKLLNSYSDLRKIYLKNYSLIAFENKIRLAVSSQ